MVPPATHGGPSPPNPQLTQQFLSNVLSQRGPSALPYSEDTKWLIRQHLVSLTSSYPSLEPKTATFTHNDGRSVNLLQADGTVPMSFQGVTYNIPVVIWLMETYPRHPPCVYVNPTRDMIIKRPHPHVNPSGLVSIPYLQNWVYPSSNLVDLSRNLSIMFGRDPPLYSQRRPNPNSSPNPNPNPNPSPSPSHGSSFGPSSSGNSLNLGPAVSSGYTRPAIPPRAYPPSPYGSGSGSYSRPQSDDPTEVYKRNAINKLVEMVHGDVTGMRKAREAEMEGMFNAQGVLRQREEQLNTGVKEMQSEMEGLEQQLQMVLMNADILEAWLRENEGKTRSLENVDVDDAFECVDSLSKQMLDCTAGDLAVEDAIYALDKAVQDGAIPFDQYLRSIRLLSREQFFHRAMGAKVRATQMQAQVANMASRISQYVS
ncbi:hypothetical protein F8388_026801 [Cannabis sativa]|uniref:Protein ELC-like n=1 Tax=Cannabis sativa TaxID=3483 RepID=A0A7J6H1I1_CANSA|nr:hypothetical protein F8388_026801 [Cannabis sativa]